MDDMARPDGERIATLEQHMVDQDKVLGSIQSDIKEIKVIVTKQDSYESRLVKLENSSNLWKWLSPSLAAILGSILTFLIINYLQQLG